MAADNWGGQLYSPSLGNQGPGGFYQVLALRGIDLEVRQGESLVDGLSLKNNAEEMRHKIGVVSHQTFLYSNLTVYENLKFYSRMYDVPNSKERILGGIGGPGTPG